MSEQGERIARMETEIEHLKQAIVDLTTRLTKVEKTIWMACGALGLLQVLISFLKH